MPKIHADPATIHTPHMNSYSHTVLCEGGRLLFLAGQAALDHDGNIVGDTVREQAEYTFGNIRAALEAHGADGSHIVKLTTFLVGKAHEHLPALGAARAAVFDFDVPPATTLVGVTSLAVDGLLVEIEAIALLD